MFRKRKKLQNSQENTCAGASFFNKVACPKNRDSDTGILSVHFAKFLRIPYLQNTSEQLILPLLRKMC